MDNIELIKPEKRHKEIIIDFVNEHRANHEFEIHGGALVEKLDFEDWLRRIADNSNKETVDKNWVVSSTFLAFRKKDNKLIACVNIRHELNDYLKSYGGHIGLGIRPTERGKGYAPEITMKALDFCREIGLQKVMLACYKDNVASRKTIERCGGILEKESALSELKDFPFETGNSEGKIVQVFWINL